ncbi:MAG: NADH-quinone oxidoreductase subunit H [Bacteroidales bacterium]|nr:NADH-quinone oxidoreductase subunit H [Bacteroidales bacterium]
MLSLVLIFIASLFFSGLISRTKSILSGRKGPGIFQPLKDVARLLRKGTVYPATCSFIYRMAPVVYFASVVAAILTVPFNGLSGILSFQYDFVFFAYILSLGKFFCIIAAMDTGSSFEGMGASREALYSMLAEPAFFLVLGSLGLLSCNNSFVDIFSHIDFSSTQALVLGIVAAIILTILNMIENSRLPLDDPKTHLELTMIHEVMILDYSGVDLALIHITGYLKFALYAALVANIFIPLARSFIGAVALFVAIQALSAIIIGVIESFYARYRMNHNPEFIFALTAVAFLVIFSTFCF